MGCTTGITAEDTEWTNRKWSKEEYQEWLLEEEKAKEEERNFLGNSSLIGSDAFTKQLMKINGRVYLYRKSRPRK